MITQNDKLGLTQSWKACVSRIKEDLKKIDEMSVSEFEGEYNDMSIEGAKENYQGQIVGYMQAIKAVESLA